MSELSEKEQGYNEGIAWAADWLIGQADSNSEEIKAFASNIADSIRSHKKPWGSKDPSACRVCGIICDGWRDGIQPVCPAHCDDHDYDYDEYERAHCCVNCFQHAPHDHFDS